MIHILKYLLQLGILDEDKLNNKFNNLIVIRTSHYIF